MSIKSYLEKRFAKDEDFKAAEKQAKIARILEERRKSANERELDRIMERKRQDYIRLQLERDRKKQMEENRRNIFKHKNIFKGHTSILNEDKKILSIKKTKEKGMFFK